MASGLKQQADTSVDFIFSDFSMFSLRRIK
jgi:hypothetical protein